MTRFLATLAGLLPSLLLAQAALEGTRADLIRGGAAPTSPQWPLMQLLVLTAVIYVAIRWGMPKLAQRLTGKMSTQLSGDIRVQETASVGMATLHVVQVRGRTLLLGSAPNAPLACLADLTEAAQLQDSEPAFFEMVDEAIAKPDRLGELLGEVIER